ncbi:MULTISPECIES: hypothetical protein [Bacillaceae]|uniref:Uncharacterized protein n=1 Tax=Evansella alkalicola TaxID=745819 RepID=A0ABS6JPZ6_9BACI|nr:MULTISPECIES: hypothetical protein [Bacillaceae]MBU9720639.1 hypothetical protein [Bacillus alkalicola]
MDNYEKDAYFERKDKLIRRLPEPEKSVYRYFREAEINNLQEHGRLIVNGKSPIKQTADHFMMETQDVKKILLSATNQLKELMNKY